MGINRSSRFTVVCATIVLLVFTGKTLASTFEAYSSESHAKLIGVAEDGADMLGLEPANAAGISYNRFKRFIVDGSSLRMFSGGIDDENRVKTKLIIIEAEEIVLNERIEFVGPTTNILFLDANAGSSSTIRCSNCAFGNFGRIALAAAVPQSIHTPAIQSVGVLNASNRGVVDVSNLDAAGALSVELFAERVVINGVVNTNLKARRDSDGNYTAAQDGNLVLGSGGVNVYTGGISLDYDNLSVTSSESRGITNQTINGNISSASISVVGADPVTFSSSSVLNTKSDVVASAYYDDNFIPTVEGVFIQSLSSAEASAKLQGRIVSDNKIQLSSFGGLRLEGSAESDKLFMAVQKRVDIASAARLKASVIDVSADWATNSGELYGQSIRFETTKNIYNHFGGKIKGDRVFLIAPNATVINGSRSEHAYIPSTSSALPIQNELASTVDASYTYGVYSHVVQAESSSPIRTNASATISANEIAIQASRVENINPYRLVKPTNEDWRNGVTLNTAKSRRVAIIAERQLQIAASEYILNASAVMGQNGSDDLVLQSPNIINQRYHLRAQLALFSQVLSADRPVQVGSTRHQGASGIETYLDQYSPPGVLYSFGRLMTSDGILDNAPGELTNQFSFLEVLGETELHETKLKSMGIALTGELFDNKEAIRCAQYGCSAENYVSYVEQETLTSFRSNVKGVRNDLVVETVNQLEDATKQQVVDSYLIDFKAQFERYEFFDATSSNVKTVEYKDYVQSWRVVPIAGGEELQIDLVRCISYTYHSASQNNLPNSCRAEVYTADVDALLNAYAETNNVNCLGYSAAEINEQLESFIGLSDQAGSFYVYSSSGHRDPYISGWYRNRSPIWNPRADCQTLEVEYKRVFEANNTSALSEYQSRTISAYSESKNIVVNLDDLFNGIAPNVPSNLRYDSLLQNNGVATFTVRWNAVSGSRIHYSFNGENVGANTSQPVEIRFDGPTSRTYRVRACNTIECSDQATITIELNIPPNPAVYDSCMSSYFGQFRSRFYSSSSDTDNYCVIYTYQNKRYFTVTTRRFYKRGYGDPGTYDCNNRRLYDRDKLVSAISSGTYDSLQPDVTLPSISGQQDNGVACNNWLGGHQKIVRN